MSAEILRGAAVAAALNERTAALCAALREAGFDVMKAENMELLTVRGYTDELWRKYARGPQVFVRQATQSTVRVVRKK